MPYDDSGNGVEFKKSRSHGPRPLVSQDRHPASSTKHLTGISRDGILLADVITTLFSGGRTDPAVAYIEREQ